jgi:hypothetical protein
MPELYKGITLLWPNPQKEFPQGFDPAQPFAQAILKPISRQDFVARLRDEHAAAVVRLEDFIPNALSPEDSPGNVQLRDNATYILVPPKYRSLVQGVSFALRIAFCYLVDFGH